MSTQYTKLREILREMFQMDQADLDFGIYRIMNAKREEIEKFIDDDLLPQIKTEITKYRGAEVETKKNDLTKLETTLRESGVDPNQSTKYQQLRDEITKYGENESIENEVFSHLTTFFRRYYNEGDFLSLRRYKKDTYAIPYEGEEVKLHWANADQYYIKTTEFLRDYAFILPNGNKVHFKLIDATEEKDNVKTESGKERKFQLFTEEPIRIEGKDLLIQFVYLSDKEKQENHNQTTLATIQQEMKAKPSTYQDFVELIMVGKAKTDKNPKRTLLEKHLNSYTARFNFDFFIHKDLGPFLLRELDFYIKNEVFFVDDLDAQDENKLKSVVAKVKVTKHIAQKIITFLAQLEDFQKKLWLKKKFVISSGYCVTLDRVPESLYPEILSNDAQREEWIKLYAIDEIKGDLVTPGYTNPLTLKFLKANPFLVLDTKHFDEQFKEKLLASFDNLDDSCDGLIIHSENFQALSLLQEKYQEKIKCIYIDPPYNTGSDGFVYKDCYQHSSWNSMMLTSGQLARNLICSDGAITISIDEVEVNRLSIIYQDLYDFINLITVKTKVAGVSGSYLGKSLRNTAEYVLLFCKNSAVFSLTDIVYDVQELTDFISDMKEQGKSWKYTTILSNIDEGEYVKTILDGSGNPIKIYKHVNYSQKSVQSIANEKFNGDINAAYIDNYKIIFRTTNAQSSIRERVISETKDIQSDFISIRYKPQKGKNTGKEIMQYYKDDIRNLVTFLGEVVIEQNGKVYKKIKSGNLWSDILYNNIASEGDSSFSNGKKPLGLLAKIINMIVNSSEDSYIVDYFAGSGTTAHAVINLNREDDGNRKYILVEMGDHFETVLKPRIQKVVFSKDWKEGKPISREGSSHMFKYLRLESYDDTLDNLVMKRTKEQENSLLQSKKAKEEYILTYMLDVETKNSDSLLNIDKFTDPFHYSLKIRKDNELKDTTVDLVETFNYLIGLYVEQTETIRGFKVLRGKLRTGEKTLVIWRNTNEKTNEDLDEFYQKQKYNTLDFEFDLIFVNGDNNLENLRVAEDKWKVRLIEEEFKKRMFEVEGR